MMIKVKEFLKKYWKWIAAGLVAIGAGIAYAFRAALSKPSDPAKLPLAEVERVATEQREQVQHDIDAEIKKRVELEISRTEAAGKLDGTLRDLDDARNLDDLDDLAGRPHGPRSSER